VIWRIRRGRSSRSFGDRFSGLTSHEEGAYPGSRRIAVRLALACLALLTVAASPRGGCGRPPYEPCAGKACGEPCAACAPGDASCVEAAAEKACDAAGACVASGTFTCPTAPVDPCAGRACGEVCTVEPPCRSATPPCLMPSVLGRCDAAGLCVAADVSCPPPPPPPGPCTGKPCGAPCSRCGDVPCMSPVATVCDGLGACVPVKPGLCADPCAGKSCGEACNPCGDAAPCPTFAATACDRSGKCVTATPWLCYDPCAGKGCHDSCEPCPPGATGCAAVLCVTWCDGAGRCLCAGGGAACP
jgi:hypothetical protein